MQDKLDRVAVIDGQQHLLVKCEVCDKCWCPTGKYRCIYGGPFNGYEERKDDSGYVERP